MNKLKFGIVGCGRIAHRHAEHMSKYGDLVAVCDNKRENAESIGTKYGASVFGSIDDMLKENRDLDLVAICTPNGLHAEHAIKTLKNGAHVLVEKPMALTVRDCEDMIHVAESSNRRLFVVKQNRFNPPIQKLKEIIENDVLGKIYSVQLNCFWNRNADYYKNSDWKGSKELDGGTLFTQFSHFIDLLYWLLGDIDEVKGFKDNFSHRDLIEFEDTGVAVMKFRNGTIGTISYSVNSYSKNFEGSVTIFAEKGTVKIGGQYLNVLEYQDIKDYKITDLEESGPANDYGGYQGSMSNHDKVYENINNVLLNGDSVRTNLLDGLKTVQIVENIYTKLKWSGSYRPDNKIKGEKKLLSEVEWM